MKRYLKRMLLLIVLIYPGIALAEEDLSGQARDTIKKAATYLTSISTKGGYAGFYSPDLSKQWGEGMFQPISKDDIYVQSPGTPTVGSVFIRAYKASGEKEYLTYARNAALVLAWAQRTPGGWEYFPSVKGYNQSVIPNERKNGRCTLDDNVTQGTVTFLMNLDELIDEEWLTDSINLGLNFIKTAQYDNGAWPQWYPLIGGYHDYFTFNDSAINDCIRVLAKAYKQYNREDCLACAKRGGDFIIASQLPAPQGGWAQQYSLDMKPAWARKFEPPGLCTVVTSQNIMTLIMLTRVTSDDKYLQPIPDAIDWLENSQIGNNLWTRLYEVGTNRPIYGDTDRKIHYNLEEISKERQTNYTWHHSYPLMAINENINFQHSRYETDELNEMNLDDSWLFINESEPSKSEIKQIIESLDSQGRWINETSQLIDVQDFVNNMNRLCKYLEVKASH
jgi:hypothetical protein